MHSRARLLLEKELFKMKKDPVWGITAQPLNEDDWFTWEATVNGPKNTLWEGGIFKLYLQFNEEYNCRPPKVYFHTVPFHPNVDPLNGIPCVDFLDNQDDWKDSYSVAYILLSLQIMLANPVLKNAVNTEAAQMCRSMKSEYRQMVLDTVLASKRVDAGLSPYLEEPVNSTTSAVITQECSSPEKQQPKVAKVSFEEYHSLWSGIATTRPVHNAKNPLNDILRSDSKLQATHFGMEQQELQEEIQKQITEHNSLMYGKFGKEKDKKDNLVEMKATRINMLKQIYLPKQAEYPPSTSNVASTLSDSISKDIEPSDHEVEELLNWSSNLDRDELFT